MAVCNLFFNVSSKSGVDYDKEEKMDKKLSLKPVWKPGYMLLQL